MRVTNRFHTFFDGFFFPVKDKVYIDVQLFRERLFGRDGNGVVGINIVVV